MSNIQVDTAALRSGSESDKDVSTPISCILCRRKSCKKCWCSFNHYWRLVVKFFVLFFYLLLGGAIFNAVERPNELREIEEVQKTRIESVNSLVQLLQNHTNLTEAEVKNLTTSIIALGEAASKTLLAEQSPIWDFSSAIFFVSTVVTTIGYGTLAPSTSAGQIIFIFYAIIGIPIALVFLSQIGIIIDGWLNHALKPVERRWGASIAHTLGVVILFLTATVVLVLIPGLVFTNIETWNYGESVYYTVVTLTTVGFGDFVPGLSSDVNEGVISVYKILSTLWLWIGLAVVSALISVVQDAIEVIAAYFHANPCCGLNNLKLKMSEKEKKIGFLDLAAPAETSKEEY